MAKEDKIVSPFKVGQFVSVIQCVAGCKAGDFAEVTELKKGELLRAVFASGAKNGKEVIFKEDQVIAASTEDAKWLELVKEKAK